jgi:hypothetical protein
MNDALALQQDSAPAQLGFQDSRSFEHMQRVAKAFAMSDLVPERFRSNIGNCVIALELATRMKVGALALMQNLYVVGGEPGWKATFIIAAINSCGKFSPLHFEIIGQGDDLGCIAWATELATGERVESPAVSVKMARAEGWFNRKGSKWQTMPELMLHYRSATIFGRLYAPEILMGLRTVDELEDIGAQRMKRARVRKIEKPQFEEEPAPAKDLYDTLEEKKQALEGPEEWPSPSKAEAEISEAAAREVVDWKLEGE